jgi:hypothetical protein
MWGDMIEQVENKYALSLLKDFKGKVYDIDGEKIEIGTLSGLYLVLSYLFFNQNKKQ